MRSLALALGLFTVVPVRSPEDPDRATVRSAILWGPVIGLAIGLLTGAALLVARLAFGTSFAGSASTGSLPALAAAVTAIIVMEVVTGGLHTDGLADSADGLASRGDRDRTLTVMRDSAIGAMGALSVMLLLLLEVSTLALAVQRGHGTEAVVTAAIAGRVGIVWACTRAPARTDGLGAWAAGSVSVVAAALVTLASLIVPAVLAAVDDDANWTSAGFVLAALPAGLAAAALLTWPLRRRLGGVTGDVLGATCQIATCAAIALVACAPA